MLADSTVVPEILTFPFATMKASTWQCILFVTLVFAFGSANAGSIARREDSNPPLSWYVNNWIDNIRNIPQYGDQIADYLNWIVSDLIFFDTVTNGALSKLFNGILPCEIGMDGPTCTGLSDNGGLRKLLINIINGIPSSALTELALSILSNVVSSFQ